MLGNVDEQCGRRGGKNDEGKEGIGCGEFLKGVEAGELFWRCLAWTYYRAEFMNAVHLVQMPTILADNGGHDSADLVSKLRAAHYEGQSDAGLGTASISLLLRGCWTKLTLQTFYARYGSGCCSIDEKARHYRELQAQTTGRGQCKRSIGDDYPVSQSEA